LNIIGSATSVENLDTDFALHKAGRVHTDYRQDTFDDLSANNSWLREATAHDEHIASEPLLSENIFGVPNEVTVVSLVRVHADCILD
jgi:hypothetical protein